MTYPIRKIAQRHSHTSLISELSKLVPIKSNNLLELARRLRDSGSDLITEEDVTNLFGRNKLVPQFESTFKAVVLAATH